NDRLAEAVLRWCRDHHRPRPRVIGFDDAPIAAWRELTTIAIPWQELTAAAANVIRRRLTGDASAATHVVVSARPVMRTL
ncbi:MAG TPA: substrate-binding domain-containing protein, partial [Tepidisphaeraceae bacterium]|nr:substrate-binding domain-containing protein [Tepidisphaeraceae bacterium]